ncbi:DNA repair protein RecO [Patescibacteria group bacterium]
MPYYRDKGVVLRSRGLKGDDRHYVVYTEGHGKVSLLAKGTRKLRSKMSPHMAVFGEVDIMVARGKRMDRLAGASLVGSRRAVMESFGRTSHLQSFLLAVDQLTRYELPEPRVYALIVEYMDAVERGVEWRLSPGGRDLLFDAAAVKLLDILGFGLELDVCVGCRRKLAFDGNGLNVLKGGVECRRCRTRDSRGIGGDAVKVLRYLRGEPLSRMPVLRLDEGVRREVAFLTEMQVTAHLEARFDVLRYMNSIQY